MHLVGFIIRIRHYARSPERKKDDDDDDGYEDDSRKGCTSKSHV